MPIKQDRMIALLQEYQELLATHEHLRQHIAMLVKFAKKQEDGYKDVWDCIAHLEQGLLQYPPPQRDAVIREEAHFKRVAKANEYTRNYMAIKRAEERGETFQPRAAAIAPSQSPKPIPQTKTSWLPDDLKQQIDAMGRELDRSPPTNSPSATSITPTGYTVNGKRVEIEITPESSLDLTDPTKVL